jgi:glycosyltransferase involved in cell wall biosynthesis
MSTAPLPRVTVGLPFHNAAPTLLAAVRSVFAQTMPSWELILVDDASTDTSLALASSVQDARVRVVTGGERRFLAARLNQIAEHARSDYVARLDADDLIHPQRLARQLAVLDADPSIDFVSSDMICIDHHEQPVGRLTLPPAPRSRADVVARGLVPHASMIARRSFLLSHPYDERWTRAEDRALFAAIWDRARYRHLPMPLYFARSNAAAADFVLRYRASSRAHRQMIRQEAAHAGVPWMLLCLSESVAKETLHRIAARMGAGPLLVRRRGTRLSAQDKAEALNVLQQVRDTQLP